jgi:hypothetical protein
MKSLTTLATELDAVRDSLLGLARAHRSVTPPAEFTATETAGLSRQVAEVISALRLPAGLLSSVTWTAKLAAAEVAALDETSRSLLADALRAVQDTNQNELILEKVRARIAGRYPFVDVRAVLFTSVEWDNGFFLDSTGTVFFADGSSETGVTFECDSELTNAYGIVGAGSALAINIRTGETSFDDYSDNVIDVVCGWLGLPELPESVW